MIWWGRRQSPEIGLEKNLRYFLAEVALEMSLEEPAGL